MIRHLVAHSLRNIQRRKGYFLINTFGLAIGIACSVIISIFILHETSYDNYHEKKDRIHRIILNGKIGGQEVMVTSTASIIGPTMVEEIPEVEAFLRMSSRSGVVIKIDNQSFVEPNCLEADSTFFEFFSIPLLSGSPKSCLSAPRNIVISESSANKIFGDENPLNKTLKVGTDTVLYTVTGVYHDIPENTHFRADMITSFMTNPRSRSQEWTTNSFESYILLKPNADPATVDAKMAKMIEKYLGEELFQFMGITLEEFFAQGNKYRIFLQPLNKIHLDPTIDAGLSSSSDPKYLYIFISVALLIILIAGINYMNLSTAQSAGRAREVGIKKLSGSTKGMLARQFLSEAILLSIGALMIALVIILLFLPYFSNLLNVQLKLDLFGNWYTIPGLVGVSVIVGLLSGIYPALFISSFKPISVLKGNYSQSAKNGKLRSVLVVFQFAISIALIIGSLVMYRQINYILNKDLGYNKENLLVLTRVGVLGDRVVSFKEEIKRISGIQSVSNSTAVPGHINNQNAYQMEGRDEAFLMQTNWVDYDYFETYGLSIEQGRFFEKEFTTHQQACIVNNRATKEYNLTDPMANRFIDGQDENGNNIYMPIIGIAKNFHFRSLHNQIQPCIFRFKTAGFNFGYISIKLDEKDQSKTIERIEEIWKLYTDNAPLQYFFMDEDLSRQYREEEQNATLAVIFSLVAIIIAALGLFGLTTFTLQQRTREIAIRKTMGASTTQIFILIASKILLLLSISTLISWAGMYFFLENWLENFYYRISLSPVEFIIGFFIALFIALFTISFKTLKAAKTNPAISLQYE